MEEKEIITTPDELQEYFINMGPQHPSTHGVLRLLVSLRGEMVKMFNLMSDIFTAELKRCARALPILRSYISPTGWITFQHISIMKQFA